MSISLPRCVNPGKQARKWEILLFFTLIDCTLQSQYLSYQMLSEHICKPSGCQKPFNRYLTLQWLSRMAVSLASVRYHVSVKIKRALKFPIHRLTFLPQRINTLYIAQSYLLYFPCHWFTSSSKKMILLKSDTFPFMMTGILLNCFWAAQASYNLLIIAWFLPSATAREFGFFLVTAFFLFFFSKLQSYTSFPSYPLQSCH